MGESFSLSLAGYAEQPEDAAAIRQACADFVASLATNYGPALVWSSFSGPGAWPAAGPGDPAYDAHHATEPDPAP